MQGLVLRDVRPRSPGSIFDKKKIFLFSTKRPVSETNKTLTKGYSGLSHRSKTAERETDRTPPSRAEINNKWNYA